MYNIWVICLACNILGKTTSVGLLQMQGEPDLFKQLQLISPLVDFAQT